MIAFLIFAVINSLKTTASKIANKITDTFAQAKSPIWASNSIPIPPAPTKPTTVASLIFIFLLSFNLLFKYFSVIALGLK